MAIDPHDSVCDVTVTGIGVYNGEQSLTAQIKASDPGLMIYKFNPEQQGSVTVQLRNNFGYTGAKLQIMSK